jgi:hypothetical protein
MLTNDASPAPCPVWKWHCRVSGRSVNYALLRFCLLSSRRQSPHTRKGELVRREDTQHSTAAAPQPPQVARWGVVRSLRER